MVWKRSALMGRQVIKLGRERIWEMASACCNRRQWKTITFSFYLEKSSAPKMNVEKINLPSFPGRRNPKCPLERPTCTHTRRVPLSSSSLPDQYKCPLKGRGEVCGSMTETSVELILHSSQHVWVFTSWTLIWTRHSQVIEIYGFLKKLTSEQLGE